MPPQAEVKRMGAFYEMRGTRPSAGLALDAWQGWVGTMAPAPFHGPHFVQEFAEKLFAFEALQPPLLTCPPGEAPEPCSLQWFLRLENQRHGKHGRWIPKLLEFAKHAGETLLALGDGLGTDWVQYAHHGANVVVCSRTPDQLELIRRNFEVRGLKGRFLHADPARMPLDSATVDVACITTLPAGDFGRRLVGEVHRVLKPGGKVLAVVPARYHVDFWRQAVFFWERWAPAAEATPAIPGEQRSASELRQLFHGFVEHRIRKRQLRRPEVPWVWRWLPLPLLARLMGRFLILKAFKPLPLVK